MQLGVISHLLNVGEERARGAVRSVEFSIDHGVTSVRDREVLSEKVLCMVKKCGNITELAFIGIPNLDTYSLLLNLCE